MIDKCALGVITDRGANIVDPTVGELSQAEVDYLEGHVFSVRRVKNLHDTRGRFRTGSTLPARLTESLTADDGGFSAIAKLLVDDLAAAMRGTSNAPSCVVALVLHGDAEDGPRSVTLLKLDAEIEAAQLRQTENGVRLRIFKDLLPRPGELQKAFSWPNNRSDDADLFVIDRNPLSAAIYFQNAFGIDASPKASETERDLVDALSALPSSELSAAVDAIDAGGIASEVVERILEVAPSFDPGAPSLGRHDSMSGVIRPNFKTKKLRFEADGIELLVPLQLRPQVITRQVGLGFVTTITTTTPLTGLNARDVDGDN